MKFKNILIIITTTAALSACSAQKQTTAQSQLHNTNSINAFIDICLNTAPSFSEAQNKAKEYEINEITDLGFMKMGITNDKSLSTQITENKECVITTPNQNNSNLTKLFTKEVSRKIGSPVSKSMPFKINIENTTFIILHDRNGGEAFVILKQEG